jgi:hypothetical protein
LDAELTYVIERSRAIIRKCLGENIVASVEEFGWNEAPPPKDSIRNLCDNIEALHFLEGVARAGISYSLGCIFGRWDVRFAMGQRLPPELPDPFMPLPVCSPGMLQGTDGLPLREAPPGYPLHINGDGILVDDPEHPDDIVRRVREVLELIWKNRTDAIEKEACL